MVTLKDKKKRSNSSRAWLTRQLNDPYVLQAKADGYRSRSAYKLREIDKKFRLLKPGQVVVDLGCAPGGWLQVVTERASDGIVIGVDLQDVAPIGNVEFIKGDFTEQSTVDILLERLNGKHVDVVLSDMAAPACGIPAVDTVRITVLVQHVADFCDQVLRSGGSMVAKVLRGGTETQILNELKRKFSKVVHFKPESSRQDSAEMFVIALGRKSNPN
ncbi:MAG: RlmE family RNA methyltransferase [Holosporales bacterium]|jgi:23S rRNA (uridine2552-2'-O)-methyltransferase|nr:RlmE family RNA methyltransferase [Holosporales bacterium]